MTRTVVERDDDTGRPTVVIYKRSAAESAERQAARRAQAERGQAVARSLRSSRAGQGGAGTAKGQAG